MIKLSVSDMKGTREIYSISDLRNALSVRYDNGVNSFEISPVGQDTPHLTVIIKQDMATLSYDSVEGNFAPDNPDNNLEPNGFTTLYYGLPTAEEEVWNPQIVTTSDALKAAEEFAVTLKLPTSISWTEL